MSPAAPSDDAILAAIPADGVSFPALAERLGLTQRKLHPLIRRLVSRGVLVTELREGVRWVHRDGLTHEACLHQIAALRRDNDGLRAALHTIHTTAGSVLAGSPR